MTQTPVRTMGRAAGRTRRRRVSVAAAALVASIASSSGPASTATAFVVPSSTRSSTYGGLTRRHPRTVAPPAPSSTSTRVVATSPSSALALVDVASTSDLATFAAETVIKAAVPATFWIVVIGFFFNRLASLSDGDGKMRPRMGFGGDVSGPVEDLYDDIYDDPSAGKSPRFLGMINNRGKGAQKAARRNLGIPSEQYLTVTKLNDRFDSYDYTLTAATKSKALAAAKMRSKSFDAALARSVDSSLSPLTPAEKTDLIKEETEFLREGGRVLREIAALQRKVTDMVIRDEMTQMDVELGEVDAHASKKKLDSMKIIDAQIESANTTSTLAEAASSNATANGKTEKKSGKSFSKSEFNKLVKELEKQNTGLLKMELEFVRAVVEIMGSDRANAIRAALLGNVVGGEAGGLLKSLQERPLAAVLASIGYSESTEVQQKSLFVADFPGDVSASQVSDLREEVTAIIRAAQPGDEALLVLQSGGGTVTGYGLAAAQLQRFKKAGIKLTICVEQVAASGGYMMCCVADKVIASPFAVLGSIGVISDMPNVYERLKKEGVEFQTVTAGKYKRTLTPTKKPTKEDFAKSKADIEDVLVLFKDFVKENRPKLDIDSVATGETWFGTDALERGLCDEIKTADEVLQEFVNSGYNVYDVKYDPEGMSAGNLLEALPFGSGADSKKQAKGAVGIGGNAVRWLVRTVLAEVKDELVNELQTQEDNFRGGGVEKRYMMRDPSESADRIRMKD